MASGSYIRLYYCEEEVAGQTPDNPEWLVCRRITDGLTEAITTETSTSTTESRFTSAGVTKESEITGTLEVELTVGLFDRFLSAAARNEWVNDVLYFGGEQSKTFTIVKVFSDINQVFIYRGVRVNEATISIAITGKITASFALAGTSFERTTSNPVANAIDESIDTVMVATVNVSEIVVNGVGTVGTACVQSNEITFSNDTEGYRCIGSKSLSYQGFNDGMLTATLAVQFAFSTQSAGYIDYMTKRAIVPLNFAIEDNLGNKYEFNFPKLEINEAGHPDGDKDTKLLTIDVSFNAIEQSPTITRTLV